MTNSLTQQPFRVAGGKYAPPHIWLPVCELDRVKRVLDSHGFRHEVSEIAVSLDNKPEHTSIGHGPRDRR